MERQKVNLFYGSLFHDIGKAIMRSTGERRKHTLVGADYLKEFLTDLSGQDQQDIIRCLKYHHAKSLTSRPTKDDLYYITYIADNIASGTDRRLTDEELESYSDKWDSKTPLYDIFNRFGKKKTENYVNPGKLRFDKLNDIDALLPTDIRKDFNHSNYIDGVLHFGHGLQAMSFTEEYMQSAVNLLEASMDFMPSSTNMEEVADVSLFDHMKLTAAFAMALQQYLEEKKITDYRSELYIHEKAFYAKQAFLMVGFKLTGLENFIYTLTSKGAHKQLRSRSFYAKMISEWFIDCLLKDLELTRANVVYNAGGQGYLLIGNTAQNRETLKKVQAEFNQFLLEHYGITMTILMGAAPFTAGQVMKQNSFKNYNVVFSDIDEMIITQERHQYSVTQINQLNQAGKKRGRECVVCHSVDNVDETEHKCQLCMKLESFSHDIQNEEYFKVDGNSEGLPIGPGAYLSVTTEESIKEGNEAGWIYAKNKMVTGLRQQTYLRFSDYSDLRNNEFSTYAKREWTKEEGDTKTTGIKRMAALRIDVDDLYAGFLGGFAHQGDGKYTTISRYATVSRKISSFFNVYLNELLASYDERVTVINSGGDDVFIIGAWDSILDTLITMDNYFKKWTAEKMSFSAGVYLYHDKMPINIVARRTKELLEAAKLAGKNRVALFTEDNVFTLEEYKNDIDGQMLSTIRRFFDSQASHGKNFIYNLLTLIRERSEEDRISFARLTYFLSRLEEQTSKEEKPNFTKFKRSMIDWFNTKVEIRKAEQSLMLYVYETRED